jgi:hypothetical protein
LIFRRYRRQLPDSGGRRKELVAIPLRSTWAITGSLLFVLVIAGFAAGRTVSEVPTADTIASFEDINGNGIDDDCEQGVVADATAAASAEAAVDLNGDGVISVSEAAQSDRTGGQNCNHGGYVSWVAQQVCDSTTDGTTDGTTEGAAPEDTPEPTPGIALALAEEVTPEPTPAEAAPATDCTTETTATDETTDATTACVPVPPPVRDPALDALKNGHGKWVSIVAQSNATGGKNCNHGGAVSEAAKKDHEAAKAARDAAKAARDAARAAAKAARGHGNPH